MKVLQVSKMYPPKIGGVERVVQQIAEGLNDRCDMEVLVCQEKGKGVVETYHGVKVKRSGSMGIFLSMPLSLSFFRDFRKAAKNADIVHFHMPFPLGDLAYFLSGHKGKLVIWWHMEVVRQKKAMALYRPLMMKFLERADLIMVATEGHVKGSPVLQQFAHKTVAIPFGLDDALLAQGLPFCSVKKPEKEPVKFLFIGRLVYYKGCDVLLKAFAQMQDKTAELIMVGDGPLRSELQDQAEKLGVSTRIKILGSLSNQALYDQIAQCDVFVLPSSERTEAFGIVQIEAMAFGKPVINTNLPTGVPWVSLDGKTGLTVEPKDIDGLAKAMDRLSTDSELREVFGRNARVRVEQEYRLPVILDKIFAQYEALMNG